MEPTSLTQVVADLKTNLDTYLEDVEKDTTNSSLADNEWALQIADIYEAAYGEELDLTQLPLI